MPKIDPPVVDSADSKSDAPVFYSPHIKVFTRNHKEIQKDIDTWILAEKRYILAQDVAMSGSFVTVTFAWIDQTTVNQLKEAMK